MSRSLQRHTCAILIATGILGSMHARVANGIETDIYAYGSAAYQACEVQALSVRPGKVIKVEFKSENSMPVYEFDIRAEDSRDWDVECHAETTEIIEIEEEVPSVLHPAFKSRKQISEAEARAIALDRFPGDILEIEYEIEPDGAASYEFDIHTYKGIEMKVEIDATSGEIVEENHEHWQEGYE